MNVISILIIFSLLSGCATFSPSIAGYVKPIPGEQTTKDKVDVLFVIKHYNKTKGIDAVPKLTNQMRNFDDLFYDAVTKLSNIGDLNVINIQPNHINNIDKRTEIERIKNENDYTVELDITQEKNFAKYFFGIIASSVSATIIPIRYKRSFDFNATVFDQRQNKIKSYQRQGSLNKWVQAFMVFLYPFHHDRRKKEKLYVESLQNIFLQMEHENILDYQNLSKTTRTIYAIEEVCKIIELHKPVETISWKHANLHNWPDKKDIAIVVHFPKDGTSQMLAKEIFKMELDELDKRTNNEGIVFWVDNEEKYPKLIISAQNETILKSQLENNHSLKILLNGIFYLPDSKQQ